MDRRNGMARRQPHKLLTLKSASVALFAANPEGMPPSVAITSTSRPTRSAANPGSRS
jgi:hypothetical protein